MQYILIPIISLALTFAGLFGAYNYLPISAFEPLSFNKPIGTTITTINGTDTLSGSRTTINNNFSALNSGKIESSTTTLPLITTLLSLNSVGTITTGTWNADAISVSKGGTGTTSPSQWLVMLGNASGGLTVASSTGSDGQVFTSRGAGLYPNWETITTDLTANYTWTGGHIFTASSTLTATTTISASSVTNGALILNGQAYKWPTSQNASSSVLMTNGSGTLLWNSINTTCKVGQDSLTGTGLKTITHNLGQVPTSVEIHAYSSEGTSVTSNSTGMSSTATSTQGNTAIITTAGSSAVSQDTTYIVNVSLNTATQGILWENNSTNFIINVTAYDHQAYLQWKVCK